MKFQFECDQRDGLVLIDETFLNELNSDLLYEFDILLDRYGKSELIYDFPNEKWDIVRERETSELFCNSGKMVVFLIDDNIINCEINICKEINKPQKYLNIPSGKLLLVNANEMIQCLSYPELDMEKILELNIEKGLYAISNDGIKNIVCSKCTFNNSIYENIEELS